MRVFPQLNIRDPELTPFPFLKSSVLTFFLTVLIVKKFYFSPSVLLKEIMINMSSVVGTKLWLFLIKTKVPSRERRYCCSASAGCGNLQQLVIISLENSGMFSKLCLFHKNQKCIDSEGFLVSHGGFCSQ